MTEFFEPEVKIIQPANQIGMPPSDAIILFDGSDVNKEWEDSRGNPTKWIVQDGSLVCVKGSVWFRQKGNSMISSFISNGNRPRK